MASEYMTAFKTPSNGIRSGESNGDEGEEFIDPGGQSEARFVSSEIVPDEESFVRPPCPSACSGTRSDPTLSASSETFPAPSRSRAGRGGAERCMRPLGVATTSASSSISPFEPSCSPLGTDLTRGNVPNRRNLDLALAESGGHVEGLEVGGPSETSRIAAQLLGEEVMEEADKGMAEEAEEHDIDAADWLDVAHAMLDRETG